MQQAIAMGAVESGREFAERLERHRKIVFKVANGYGRDAHERADIAQEIAAQLWRAYPAYDGKRAFPTWMYRIALNVAISHLRATSLRERHSVPLDESLHDSAGAAGIEAENDGRVRELRRCIERLDPLNRALLLLYLDERSQAEIAEILGITETNVATKIGRLKERLRKDLADAQ